jgi:hypothetical protein
MGEGNKMRWLLIVSAVLAWLFGAALLLVPGAFYAPLGLSPGTALQATVPQAHGATLFGLGVVNWMGRNLDRRGQDAIAVGNLVVQVLSLLVAVLTITAGAGGAGAPAVVIHVVLGGLFAVFLWRDWQMVGA